MVSNEVLHPQVAYRQVPRSVRMSVSHLHVWAHLVSILIHRCLSSFVLALSIRPRRTLGFTGHVQSLKTPFLRPMRRNMCGFDFLLRPCWRRVRGFAPWFPGRRSCLRAPFPSPSPICPRLWPICPTKARIPRSFSPRPRGRGKNGDEEMTKG